MHKIAFFVSVAAILLAPLLTGPSAAAIQSKQTETPSTNLESLLSETGYKPIKVREGAWGVPGFPYKGQNLKMVDTFLEINPDNGLLRISARIGFHDHQENDEFKKTVDSLTTRLKPTKFALSKQSLFAVIELPPDKLDKTRLVQAMEKAAGEADKAYPDVAKFIIKPPVIPLLGPPSLGPGSGEGMGTGRGAGVGPASPSYGTSQNPQVDSKPVVIDKGPGPAYTEKARQNKVQGSVLLRVLIDETGAPKRIMIVRGLPDGLNERAIEAVQKMKFRPAMKDAKPVSFSIALEVSFKLR